MANCEGTSSPDPRCVLVNTNLETHIATLVHKDEAVSDFKEKFCKEHKKCFPQVGEINITAFKVKRRGYFFHMPDSMIMSTLFNSTSKLWFMYADLVRVDKTIMAADQSEKKKEMTIDTDDLTSGEALGTEKQSRKRKSESSDAKESRKKPAIESCEKRGISMGENQQSCDAGQEKTITINSELVDGHTIDVQPNLGTELIMGKSNESRKSCGSEKLDHLTGAIEQDLEKGEETAELVKIDRDKDVAPTIEPVDGHTSSRDDVNERQVEAALAGDSHFVVLPREKLDEFLSGAGAGAIERGNKRGEESRLAPSAADSLQTAELEASSGLTATEKKRKRKKSSTDHMSQSTAAEAIQKENELGVGPANHLEANSPATERKKKRKKSSKDHMKQSSGRIACVDTLEEAIQNENDNFSAVGSKEATHIIVADKLETVSNVQAADLVHALVQESKTLDHIEVEMEAKSVRKSRKKKKSRKEASLENVEPVKVVVDGQGCDKVIRNVLDSLQERNEKEEKSGKKSSKRSKKRSLNVEVEAALPINKPEASLTPQDTERDAKESIEDHHKDMGDNFEEDGKKQDEVSGGAKSKKPKERKSRAKAAASSSVKNDDIGLKVDHSSPVPVKKNSKLNFFKDEDKSDSTQDEASYVSSQTGFVRP